MKRIVLVFGLLAGIIVSALMSMSMIRMSDNPDAKIGPSAMIIGYLSMIIGLSLIFVAVKNYRDKQNHGIISFSKAFKIGLFISLIASTLYVISWALVYNFVLPNFMEVYSAAMVKEAQATASATEMNAKMKEIAQMKEMYKNPLFFTLFTYLEILPVGLLVSLITALILKRKNRPMQATMAV